MTKSKLKRPGDRTMSKLTHSINRTRNTATKYRRANDRKRNQLKKYEALVKDLLDNKIITKSYVSKFITKKNIKYAISQQSAQSHQEINKDKINVTPKQDKSNLGIQKLDPNDINSQQRVEVNKR